MQPATPTETVARGFPPEKPAGWFYRAGRALLDQTIGLYYRRIQVIGGRRIPTAGPAIIVANHPNSVADAYLLASRLTSRKINFIAKDIITRAPVFGWIARQFGVVGVAREMDYGRRRGLAFERNRAALGACVPRLLDGELLAIFGEGVSDDARCLHTIRKGALRFGYGAEQQAGFHLGVVWIPVGISYSAKQRFRSDVLIRVGEPFRLTDLHAAPADHGAEVLQLGTQRLQRDLESLIVNIQHDELAALIDGLAEVLSGQAGALLPKVERHQRIARAAEYFNQTQPRRLIEIGNELRSYRRKLAATGLTDEVVRQRHAGRMLWLSLLGVIKSSVLMVLNLYGWANSLVPRWAAYAFGRFGRQRISQPQAAGEPGTIDVAKQALFGTIGGWAGAALAFPAQIWMVFHFSRPLWGASAALAASLLYALTLLPSWRVFVRRRDVLRGHWGNLRAAVRFLAASRPATRLQLERRRLQRHLRTLLADYDATNRA